MFTAYNLSTLTRMASPYKSQVSSIVTGTGTGTGMEGDTQYTWEGEHSMHMGGGDRAGAGEDEGWWRWGLYIFLEQLLLQPSSLLS